MEEFKQYRKIKKKTLENTKVDHQLETVVGKHCTGVCRPCATLVAIRFDGRKERRLENSSVGRVAAEDPWNSVKMPSNTDSFFRVCRQRVAPSTSIFDRHVDQLLIFS